ncbi:hypothetical protein EBB59_03130 [Lysobacter pythonis]|uniref:Cobalamin ABC transporter n=1 Tax=Solilutibacter pythonis TaxID=2483112 RepID=A0A3M2I6T8_9GAMM|nr:hypothetical protein [Lysobacter pythonis]RMH94167.1 hypothetical protein EBB59_03130 [Lysobacter pythonis]
MQNDPPRRTLVVSVALTLAMTLTRFQHIGALLHLYDASMAVFFLGGLLLRRHAWFLAYLVLAVGIDFTAITLRGENFLQSHCVTPGYGFLLLSYAALWYSGRLYAPRLGRSAGALAGALACGFAAAVVAFLISNGAFYWLGGRYPDPHWAQYVARVWQWGPSYVRVATLYVGVGLAAWAVASALAGRGGARIARA